MKVIIFGKGGALQDAVVAEFAKYEYELVFSDDREKSPGHDFDICVDMSARSISDVRQVLKNFKGSLTHYILLSTCRVYPPTSRISPWQSHEIDLCDDTGFNTVDIGVRRCRATERELKHIGSKAIPWTILRPSIVEVKETPDADNMWWFVSRILDGGPIILPDSDDPLFRHVSGADVAQAIRVVAGQKEAFYQTIHVTSHALITFESYARLIMSGLNKKVSITRVAAARWKAAGLSVAMGSFLRSSFIDDSLLLDRLGWQPCEEREWVQEHAEYLIAHQLDQPARRKDELALLEYSPENLFGTIKHPESENWKLVGKLGEPSSFHLEYFSEKRELPAPILRTRKVVMGMAEERFFIEQPPEQSFRVLGHNALLELVEPGESGLQGGALFLPVAQRPCNDSRCIHCAECGPGVSGVTDDGFATQFVAIPSPHLVPVPGELQGVALLADPLACLLAVIPSLLAACSGPVWVFGERIDALLAIILVKDADCTFLHVNRTRVSMKNLPFAMESMSLQRAQKKVQGEALEKPGMVINLSGTRDGENLLARALSDGGFLVTPFAATRTLKRRVDVRLPVVAPGRSWLENALEQLGVWSSVYDLDTFLRVVKLEHYQDLFLGGQFCQSFVDEMKSGK